METFLAILFIKIIYNYPTVLMVSSWETNSYFDNEQFQIIDVELMNDAYG